MGYFTMSKLKWQCRRGMRELDELLLNYMENSYPQAPHEQQMAFAKILECSDDDLYIWLIQKQIPEQAEDALRTVLTALQQYNMSA